MLLLQILSAATALSVSAHAAQARQSLLDETILSCRDVNFTPGPGLDCKYYIRDPTTGDLRSTLLSFPSTWSSDQADTNPYPLILSFHGRTKNSSEQQLLTGFSDNTINAIAAYPQGEPRGKKSEWQGDPSAQTNDVAFVTSLIGSLTASTEYGIDSSRIYATGKSGGGGLLNILACDPYLSSTIAAFAAVSGAFYENGTSGQGEPPLVLPTCAPNTVTRAVPFMEFHGTSDCIIRYDGGLNTRGNGYTRPVFDVVTFWADQKGCVANKITPYGSCNITKYSWNCRNVDDTVVHYRIPDLMHDWPNVNGNDDCRDPNMTHPACLDGKCNTCIEATPIITEWLQRFSITPNSTPLESSEPPTLEL